MLLSVSALRGWRTVRRYAVPPAMIHRATERRLAGDWRGACAAADVAVGVDLAALTVRHGAGVAERVEDDLGVLGPLFRRPPS
ncbi:hypothetical protein OHA72_33910 [Dactylosporangium sp. NBC_01737]|uniref:hypothetical protein n=1 Tax=Dactylosporangium sp. NBC_01737 TaxID=2975959 RepID=UPI002E1357A7|nr:hypothetical protein OHA72_33910 [Dactylosporangium sp. NBC_01737]